MELQSVNTFREVGQLTTNITKKKADLLELPEPIIPKILDFLYNVRDSDNGLHDLYHISCVSKAFFKLAQPIIFNIEKAIKIRTWFNYPTYARFLSFRLSCLKIKELETFAPIFRHPPACIDWIKPDHVSDPITRFIDTYGRKGFVLKIEVDSLEVKTEAIERIIWATKNLFYRELPLDPLQFSSRAFKILKKNLALLFQSHIKKIETTIVFHEHSRLEHSEKRPTDPDEWHWYRPEVQSNSYLCTERNFETEQDLKALVENRDPKYKLSRPDLTMRKSFRATAMILTSVVLAIIFQYSLRYFSRRSA